jgi:hypothetical protein
MALALIAMIALTLAPTGGTQPVIPTLQACAADVDRTLISKAQRLFYNGDYDGAIALSDGACDTPQSLPLCEMRSSALLFAVKQALPPRRNGQEGRLAKNCTICQPLIAQFIAETSRGQSHARTTLRANPLDQGTRFLLAKLDLNYVWLQLGLLGRKTGWSEYWEARRSVDAVLAADPAHVRARVARAWIDYIVDTRMPFGTGWLLGGGNKQRALRTLQLTADAGGEFYDRAETGFALWDIQIREQQMLDAVATARRLACEFPDNQELRRFLQQHDRK